MKKLVAIGGDVFAGLFSAGVQEAGFTVPIHLENSNYGNKTCKLNFPKIDTRIGVESWRAKDISKEVGHVNLMFANPPCAIWSNASPRTDHWTLDPRMDWHKNLTKAAQIIRPDAYVVESVIQAWDKGRGFMIDNAKKWQDLNYSVTVLLQNNMYIGGTQNRKRVFFIAHTHPLVWPAFTNPQTVGEILKPLGRQTGKPLRENLDWCYKHSRPGDKFRKISFNPDYKGPKLNFFFSRLNPKEPPPVLIGYESLIHPTQRRWCNQQESFLLNDCPPKWQSACGSMSAISAECARAVHRGPGRWIASAVKRGLTEPKISMGQFALIDFRNPEQPLTRNLWEAAKEGKF